MYLYSEAHFFFQSFLYFLPCRISSRHLSHPVLLFTIHPNCFYKYPYPIKKGERHLWQGGEKEDEGQKEVEKEREEKEYT